MDAGGLRKRYNESDKKSDSKDLESIKDNSSSDCSIGKFLFIFLLLILAIAHLLSPISAVSINDIVEVTFEGLFTINERLSKGLKIPMFAPESIVEDDHKNLYVGLRDGKIVKIYPSKLDKVGEGKIEKLFNGKLNTSLTTSLSHGIPLGLRLRGNTLFVMDAIFGFFTLDLNTLKLKLLVKPTDVLPSMKFPNDFDINSKGTVIYFTDSSYKYPINKIVEEVMEGTCTGRLFSFHIETKQIHLLTAGLCFANGVQLTKNEKFVIVSETTRYRVSWIDVDTGKKKIILHLPAMPDNVRSNRHGSYWIAASAKLTRPFAFLLQYPTLRQILAGMLPEPVLMRVPNRKHNMLFEVNDNGELLSSSHDPFGKLTFALSQATELSDGRVALGSYAAPYLAIADKADE